MAQQSIIPLIRDADRGRLVQEMQVGLDDIVAAIEAARGAGTGEITVKLKIKSTAEGVYAITPDLKVKLPVPKRSDMMTFLTNEGELVRRDPRQPDIPGVVPADFRTGAQDQ